MILALSSTFYPLNHHLNPERGLVIFRKHKNTKKKSIEGIELIVCGNLLDVELCLEGLIQEIWAWRFREYFGEPRWTDTNPSGVNFNLFSQLQFLRLILYITFQKNEGSVTNIEWKLIWITNYYYAGIKCKSLERLREYFIRVCSLVSMDEGSTLQFASFFFMLS